MEVASKILELFGYFLALTLAIDVVQWSFTGRTTDTGVTLISNIIDKITILPLAVIQLIFNLAVGLVVALLKMVIGIILPSIADKIVITPVDILSKA